MSDVRGRMQMLIEILGEAPDERPGDDPVRIISARVIAALRKKYPAPKGPPPELPAPRSPTLPTTTGQWSY
jgi:hypothetical protein